MATAIVVMVVADGSGDDGKERKMEETKWGKRKRWTLENDGRENSFLDEKISECSKL